MYRILLILLKVLVTLNNAEKIQYISTEHPFVTYYNTKYLSYLNLTSQRYGREDPFYYVGLHTYVVSTFGSNVSVHFYFYEYLSNTYKRGFVEMHFTICDLTSNKQMFGAIRQGKFLKPCPYDPGVYHLYNMTIGVKHVPRNFPFKKGRIYCNISGTVTNELVASGYIDMELKEAHIKKIPN